MKEGLDVALVKLDAKGRLVIPKKIRSNAGIEIGNMLFVYTFEKLVFLRKAEIDHKPVIKTLRRLKPAQGA
jgi:AbrB family looped-hinge helix DNA binding protein